jgi:hypothetical protein
VPSSATAIQRSPLSIRRLTTSAAAWGPAAHKHRIKGRKSYEVT